jgi:hypothetical protein
VGRDGTRRNHRKIGTSQGRPQFSGGNTAISSLRAGKPVDWVENCPAFGEHGAGVLELVNDFDEDRDVETPDPATVSADADWFVPDDVGVATPDGESVGD